MILQQKASSKELNFIFAGRGDWINVFLVGVLRFYSGERRACQLNGSVGGGLHTRARQTWGGRNCRSGVPDVGARKKKTLNARKESWRHAKNRKRQRLRVRADVGAGFCVSGEVR